MLSLVWAGNHEREWLGPRQMQVKWTQVGLFGSLSPRVRNEESQKTGIYFFFLMSWDTYCRWSVALRILVTELDCFHTSPLLYFAKKKKKKKCQQQLWGKLKVVLGTTHLSSGELFFRFQKSLYIHNAWPKVGLNEWCFYSSNINKTHD